jgi:AraC-like DNA-binding protein
MNMQATPSQIISGSREGSIQDASKPVIASASLVSQAHLIAAHTHHRGQLLYASQGVMQVVTATRSWYVTPQYGIWIAPNERHFIAAEQAIAYRSIFLEPDCLTAAFNHSKAVMLTTEMRELIDEAAMVGEQYQSHSAECRLYSKLYECFRTVNAATFAVPLPRHKTLRQITEGILATPDQSLQLKDFSAQLHLSERNLLRAFVRETGLSFCQWRQQALVTLALERMVEGESLTRIALDFGYTSPATFSTMFKRVTGVKPSQYLKQN